MTTKPARVVLVTRRGCHLCDVAAQALDRLGAEDGFGWRSVDVDGDPVLHQQWTDLVPVVLVDGVERCHYRLDPQSVRAALAQHG